MSNVPTKKKTSRGRQKIEIKQLEKQSTKEVTFSKRRAGLFKKAGELCILCGAEVGIVVFSPAGKPYCFGHPNIETMLNRYVSNNTSYEPAMITLPVEEYNQAYEKSVEELKEEKRRAVKANEEAMKKPKNNDMQWLNENIDNIGADEIHDYFTALQELRKKVLARYESLRIDNNAMMFSNPLGPVGFGYHQFGNGLSGVGDNFNGFGGGGIGPIGSSFFNGFSSGHGFF